MGSAALAAPGRPRTGTGPVTGRGVSMMVRSNGYWAGIAEVAVTPATGAVQVTRFMIGLECGKIINRGSSTGA
jgi:nicotinate dehydrogenase subunit B